MADLDIPVPIDEERLHTAKLPPREWVKKNLFNNASNSVTSVVLIVLIAIGAFFSLRFVFVTGQWEPVRRNLENFMLGNLFPRGERWRIVTQMILISGAFGMAWGTGIGAARDRAEEAGIEHEEIPLLQRVRDFWAVLLFLFVLLAAFTRTIWPTLLTLACVALIVGLRTVTKPLPQSLRPLSAGLAGFMGVVSFQVLTGTGGWAYAFTTIVLAFPVLSLIGDTDEPELEKFRWPAAAVSAAVVVWQIVGGLNFFSVIIALIGLAGVLAATQAARGAVQIGAFLALGTIAFLVYDAIDASGVDWKDWGGIHLTLVATVAAIVLAFPLGLLLALGRRSDLPVIRLLSVIYIEMFRGVPLISLLLMAQFFIGFFLDTDDPLSLITRAIAAMTIFSAAYVAEIVRGGLQAVPPGQVEAGQAVGLSQPRIMRLIVLPQALRAVIPAMVGQFISLFKDTSLLAIIGVTEWLNVREIVHAQPDFRNLGIAETLVFIAFGYWAFAYTMSKESQRLERRLGVGER